MAILMDYLFLNVGLSHARCYKMTADAVNFNSERCKHFTVQ